MFTIAAMIATALIAWSVRRSLTSEKKVPFQFDEDQVRQSVVFARDDLKLIALLLAAILITLGVIADRVS